MDRSIFEFADYKEFLQEFVALHKRNRSWSLGVWSRKLGIHGNGTISRILSGQRIPGPQLTEELIRYFQFANEEANYFRKLVERERYYQNGIFPGDPMLVLRNGHSLITQGSVSFERASEFLAPLGLEPVPINGVVVASLNTNVFPYSACGPYSDVYACISVKPMKGGLLDYGLYFFGFYCNSSNLISFCSKQGAHKAKLANLGINRSPTSLVSWIGEENNTLQRMTPELAPLTRVEDMYDLNMYSKDTDEKLFKAKFTIDSVAWEREFNPQSDTLKIEEHDFGQTLSQLEFKPSKWVVHPNLFSLLYFPTGIERGSY